MRTRPSSWRSTLTAAALGRPCRADGAAERRAAAGPGIVGYVTAESRYSGPASPAGAPGSARPPRGAPARRHLDECGRSCSDTLRRETVDFWQNHGGSAQGATAPATCSSGSDGDRIGQPSARNPQRLPDASLRVRQSSIGAGALEQLDGAVEVACPSARSRPSSRAGGGRPTGGPCRGRAAAARRGCGRAPRSGAGCRAGC